MTTARIHSLVLPLTFPQGISPGAGGDYNVLAVAREGASRPILRGSALAGLLRHAYERCLRSARPEANDEAIRQDVEAFFGASAAEEARGESPLRVPDCRLDLGGGSVIQRTYHFRNRHTGAVADGGLFDIEICPPGTKATAVLWFHDANATPEEARNVLGHIAGFFRGGLALGGRSARGIGMAELADAPRYTCYDLRDTEQHAAWLDADRAWREAGSAPRGEPLDVTGEGQNDLVVNFTLVIPRGQDLLIGDGQGLDYEMEPQRVTAADGKDYWRLPGASLRGLFRSWVSRLAAREGKPVADSVERHQEREQKNRKDGELRGDDAGWCFAPQDKRRHGGMEVTCPAAKLFGSLFEAGRIHISDAYAPIPDGPRQKTEQVRMHVAVDRITGGAAEGMLFDNTVLTSASANGDSPRFEVTIRVQNVKEHEARWLAQTLLALHLGILRVGSSKSAGRLKLAQKPSAKGPHSELFETVDPVAEIPAWAVSGRTDQ